MHGLDVCEEISGIRRGVVVDNLMVHFAQEKKVVEAVPLFLRLVAVVARTSCTCGSDVAHIPGLRTRRMDDGGVAVVMGATVAREGKEAFDGL